MNYSVFMLAVKSTLDFHIKTLADANNLGFIDLDADTFDAKLVESDKPALCWEFSAFAEAPIDPLYHVEFDVGVRATKDPAQYMSLEQAGKVRELFKPASMFVVMDYSKPAAPTEKLGTIYIATSAVPPLQADRIVGIRFVSISARSVREVGNG